MALGIQPRYCCANVQAGCRHALADKLFSAAEFERMGGLCRTPDGAGCGQALASGKPLDRRGAWAARALAVVLLAGAAGLGVRQVFFPPPLEHLDFATRESQAADTAGLLAIDVVRQAGLEEAATVEYAASDGSAKAGEDYTAVHGTLRFEPGEKRKAVSVPLLPDTSFQKARRYFSVSLLNVRGTPTHLVYIAQRPVANSERQMAEQSVLAASRTAKDIADFVVRLEALQRLLANSRDKPADFNQYQNALTTVSGNLSRARESYMQMLREFKALQPATVLGAMDSVTADLQRKGFAQQSLAVAIMKRQFGELLNNASPDMDRWAQELSQVVPRVGSKPPAGLT